MQKNAASSLWDSHHHTDKVEVCSIAFGAQYEIKESVFCERSDPANVVILQA